MQQLVFDQEPPQPASLELTHPAADRKPFLANADRKPIPAARAAAKPISAGPPPKCVDDALVRLLDPAGADALRLIAEETTRSNRPATVACSQLQQYASSDVSRVSICGAPAFAAPCTIFSFSGRSTVDVRFETEMSDSTACDIVLADCLVKEADVVKALPPRARLMPLCLSKARHIDPNGWDFNTIKGVMMVREGAKRAIARSRSLRHPRSLTCRPPG